MPRLASRPGGGTPRQPGVISRPWRYLAVLAALLIVMLGTIIGSAVAHPGDWHSKFKVGLGLDLSSGTTITIKAVPLKEHGHKDATPSSSAMAQSIAILNSRVNGQGFTGAKVQQQGSNLIVVSVPGKSAQDISPLLSSAVLRFRQVLLLARGYPVPLPPPSAGSNPSASPSPAPSSTPAASHSAAASPTPSPSGSLSGGTAHAYGSRLLNGAGRASAKSSGSASPSASGSPSASPSASPSPSGSPSPSPSPSLSTRLATVADASGDVTKIKSQAVISDFNRLNCKNKDWQKR